MKKKLVFVLVTLMILSLVAVLVGCNIQKGDNSTNGDGSSQVEQNRNEQIYNIYLSYAQNARNNNQEPLNYEDWLDSIRGADGVNGQDGKDGENGQDGKSAYQIWLDNGFSGTEMDFLNWLKGDKGDKGDDGQNGTDGIDGTNGVDGHTPVIEIGTNGNWFIDGTDTGVKALGSDGTNGADGKDGVNGSDGKDGINGQDGADGVGIKKIEKTSSKGLVDTYTITLTNGNTTTFTITNGQNGTNGIDGVNGSDGKDGINGKDGADGVGIKKIEKTSSEGLVDTYTITLTNGNTSTFTVINGQNGTDGIDGTNGVDGHTPVIEIGTNGNWFIDGTDTGVKALGSDGTNGADGKDGLDGKDGQDGKSAYQIWLDNGNTGTEEDFFDWLKGDGAYRGLSIKTIYVNDACDLIMELTDGKIINCGSIIPPTTDEQGLNFQLKKDGTYSVAVGNATNLSNIVIPKKFNGRKVTEIEEYGFNNLSKLESITIPDSITSIGYAAFYNCTSLTRVDITSIEAWCGISFYCDYDDLAFSSNPLYYANSLYLNDVLVDELVIPSGVTHIVGGAFYGYKGLISVVIPDSVTSIDDGAFLACSSLIIAEMLDISEMSIGSYAFYGCSKLTIYCESVGKPEGWDDSWNNIPVVWGDDPSLSRCLATFEFGSNGSNTHIDGKRNDYYSAENNGYNFQLYDSTGVFVGGNDACGNSCMKLGTTSIIGSIKFTVADDVNVVKIYIAGYKNNSAYIIINGDEFIINTTSNNGEYTLIEIDVSQNKTVVLETTESNYRAMIDTIRFFS